MKRINTLEKGVFKIEKKYQETETAFDKLVDDCAKFDEFLRQNNTPKPEMPVSCRLRTRLPAPQIHIRISDEALPPSTGLSCISATRMPFLAAAIAASIPEMPPPTTQKSTSCIFLRSSSIFLLTSLEKVKNLCYSYDNAQNPSFLWEL